MVHANLPILPLGDNVTNIEVDGFRFLIDLYVPHDAPKHSAIIKIDLDFLTPIYDLEPINRQSQRGAWGKHQFVVKRDGVEYLLATQY